MRIDEVMDTDVPVCEPLSSLAQVATMMATHDVNALPVVRHGKLFGMVHDRDIVVRGLAAGLDPDTPVAEVVSGETAYCLPESDLDEVIDMMCSRQLMRLPVASADGMLVGIVVLQHLVASERSVLLTWRAAGQ